MSTTSGASALGLNIPQPGASFLVGRPEPISPVWWAFLLQLYRRTGDQTGGDGQLTTADVLGLETDIPQPVDISAQVAVLGISLQQAFAAIGSLQQAIPGFGEIFAAAGVSQGILADVTGMPGSADPLNDQTLAAPAPAPQITEAGLFESPVRASDALSEMVFPSVVPNNSAQAPIAITPGASPYTYTANSRQGVHIASGTISALHYARGSTSLPLGLQTSGQIFELNAGDALLITYSVAPTMTMIPR